MIEETLQSLIQQANDGTIQIPEFQRELIVDDEWARSVLASVSLGYPIGAFMLLRAGSPDLEFGTQRIAGSPARGARPQWLLVDGQRRLTVLYQALTTPGYYVDIERALDPAADRDDAIVVAPEGGPGLVPLDRTFTDAPENEIVVAFREYVVPIIVLPRETTRWTVRMHGGPNGRALSDEYTRRARG